MPAPKYINMNRVGERQLDALGYFVEYGITAFRMSKDGQIAWIKDGNFGWVSADRWLLMNRVKGLLSSPLIGEIVEGGYRINSFVYGLNFEVSIKGFEIPMPIGPGLVILTGAAVLTALQAGDYTTALTLAAALMAPYGSLYLLMYWADVMYDKLGQLVDVVKLTQSVQSPLLLLWNAAFGSLFEGGGSSAKGPPASA